MCNTRRQRYYSITIIHNFSITKIINSLQISIDSDNLVNIIFYPFLVRLIFFMYIYVLIV